MRLKTKTPVFLRIDGKNFSGWTHRNCVRPFDLRLSYLMYRTALYLVSNIQNAVLAYTQSDEISILLADYKTEATQPWFDYRIEKLDSISASMTTAFFNGNSPFEEPAVFDARAFNKEKSEICTYLESRRKNCIVNSVHSYARKYFSHNELRGLSTNEVQRLLIDAGKPWESLDKRLKFGQLVIKTEVKCPTTMEDFNEIYNRWLADV